MIDLPNESEREYLDVFGVVAIYIATTPAGEPCMIGTTNDLAQAIVQLRKQWHWSVELVEVFWIADDATARKLIDAVHSRIAFARADRLDTSAEQLTAMLIRQAHERGMRLTGHEQALKRVRVALEYVNRVIDSANDSGELSWFNSAYRAYRIANGEHAMSYNNARALLRTAMVKRIALDAGCPLLTADLLHEVGIMHRPAMRRLKAT